MAHVLTTYTDFLSKCIGWIDVGSVARPRFNSLQEFVAGSWLLAKYDCLSVAVHTPRTCWMTQKSYNLCCNYHQTQHQLLTELKSFTRKKIIVPNYKSNFTLFCRFLWNLLLHLKKLPIQMIQAFIYFKATNEGNQNCYWYGWGIVLCGCNTII